jgi:hypothetical protein
MDGRIDDNIASNNSFINILLSWSIIPNIVDRHTELTGGMGV